MRPEYDKWRKEQFPDPAEARGQCENASRAMAEKFPKLRLARGFVHLLDGGREQHWWCVDPHGNIVDPTWHQYIFMPMEYEEVADDDPWVLYPTRKCMNCGQYFLNSPCHKWGGHACSKECDDELCEAFN